MTALPRPFFLDSSSGRCFAVHHTPDENVKTWGHVLCVPAFNEEMNRCRSMVTLQAQAFAEKGVGTLVIDLHGTGESDGEHSDARWEAWLEDIAAGIAWLDNQPGGCIALLGIRLGVPLAVQSLRSMFTPRRALIAWQPVVDGKAYFTQFLRIRVAGNMDRTDIPKETTAAMRNALAGGKPIEVAGYEVHPKLAAAIEGVRLSKLQPQGGEPRIAWFERSTGNAREALPVSMSAMEEWRSCGLTVDLKIYDGPAFWAAYERATAPDLILQTTEWVSVLRQKA